MFHPGDPGVDGDLAHPAQKRKTADLCLPPFFDIACISSVRNKSGGSKDV
jgi:hypothetical protein